MSDQPDEPQELLESLLSPEEVERGGDVVAAPPSVVEDEDVGLLDECSCNGDTLFLAS